MWAGDVVPVEQHKDRLIELGISDGYPTPASISSLIYTTDDPAEISTLAYSRPMRMTPSSGLLMRMSGLEEPQ
jgi:hypothetical protein